MTTSDERAAFEQAKEWGRELVLLACARDIADALGTTVAAVLPAVRKAAEPPPPPTTLEEFVKAKIRDALDARIVYGHRLPQRR